MQKEITKLYQKVSDIQTKEEFQKNIDKIKKETDNLFDDETAALLILDEKDRNDENIFKIKQLEAGIECTITGQITNIGSQRDFNRKNGSVGRVVNLDITDETGTINLVLWNNDVEQVQNQQIRNGTHVKIINGYVKNGYNGVEINIGRYSLIKILKHDENKTKNETTIKGMLIDKTSTRSFFRDNGEFGFVSNMKIKTKDEIKEITIWDEKVKELQKFKTGDNIEISNFDTKQKNGKIEIHLNEKTKMKKT